MLLLLFVAIGIWKKFIFNTGNWKLARWEDSSSWHIFHSSYFLFHSFFSILFSNTILQSSTIFPSLYIFFIFLLHSLTSPLLPYAQHFLYTHIHMYIKLCCICPFFILCSFSSFTFITCHSCSPYFPTHSLCFLGALLLDFSRLVETFDGSVFIPLLCSQASGPVINR